MKDGIRHDNLIIYLFIISIIFMACGMGLDTCMDKSLSTSESVVMSQTFEVGDSLQNVQLQENNYALKFIREYKNSSRSKVYGKRNVLLIVILIILLGIFRIVQYMRGLCHAKFNRYKAFIIAYIHDMDGRKRLLWS
ncbi:MAG: hypothetical protein IJ167_11990 [Lachnospiraceae bacterium]|nr:hypothetical protein [Lachnospiraceae bacterium]